MKSFPSRPVDPRLRTGPGFTLVEVLAALLLMAIIIPVAMQGMSIASRAGILGQRKAAAMRIAERMLNELIVTDQLAHDSAGGSQTDGDTTYAWTMQSAQWSEAPMTEMTVHVTFSLQGHDYEIRATTLFDPAVNAANPATP